MYYRSEKPSVCADVIPYYENGTYYLFYLLSYRDSAKGEGCPWCLVTTTDLVHYTDHGVVIPEGDLTSQDLEVFTGSCTKHNGEYYIFYTGRSLRKKAAGLPEQKIMLAKSTDLYHWEKVPGFELTAPEQFEMHDYRDPFVFFHEEKQCYCMLLAGRNKAHVPSNSRGVTLALYSDDLLHWSQPEEFYAPSAYFTHECPDLFKLGDWWYLIFSEFSDKHTTTYRMAKSPSGPWITPKVNTFDGHPFYAAKSAFDGKRRILFGWNCIKEGEKDDAGWVWGGTVIPHEIVQAEDGTLFVKCPEEVKNAYSVPQALTETYRMGAILPYGQGLSLQADAGRNICLFGQMPDNCRIELDFTAVDDIGDFGILLRASDLADEHYAVKLEPKYNRMAFDKLPRKDSRIHIQVDTERYCPIVTGQKNHMVIIVEDSIAEIYVNDQIAMSVRMFDRRQGKWGMYSHNSSILFENIQLFTF